MPSGVHGQKRQIDGKAQPKRSAIKLKRNEERRADMTNQERLMAALFDNPQREHVDIKFFVVGGMDLTADKLCAEAADMLQQMDDNEGDRDFVEAFQQRDASAFIASI